MANLYEQFQTDMKEAMKARDSVRVNVLRMAMSAIKTALSNQVKQAYDAAGGEANLAAAEAAAQAVVLSDVQVQDIVAKEVKRRREAAELFRKGNRQDLVETEETEAAILEHYLPRMLSADELRPEITALLAEIGATGVADMNKAMPVVMQRYKGKADGRVLNQLVRELLHA
jgi:uncharacterized protein YqeY